MTVERMVLKEDLDVMSVDQLQRELRGFPKTQVTVTRHGYDVDGKDPIRLEELGAKAGETVTVSCKGRQEAECARAIRALLG